MKAVNLITTDERRAPSIPTGRSGGGAYVVLVLLGGLAVFALLYGLADHAIGKRRSEVVSLTARAQQAQERAGALSPYTSFLQMREQRVQTVTQLVGSRFDWAQAFHELGRVLPPGKVSLASLAGTVGSGSSAGASSSSSSAASGSSASGSSVTSATPPGSIPTFALTGCAVSQAEVALMLNRLRLIDGVSEVTLQSSTKSGAGGGGGGGSSCEGGNVSFSAQVTFDALPSVSTAGGSSSAGPASTAATPASSPAASTAPVSTSSAGAVR
jgi:Tfp pilus assembly protein PilN